jgi:hypothetical protein
MHSSHYWPVRTPVVHAWKTNKHKQVKRPKLNVGLGSKATRSLALVL